MITNNDRDPCVVEYDFEVELHPLIDHNIMIHVDIKEDGPCWYDETGPGHMDYTYELKGFSIEFINEKDGMEFTDWWYHKYNPMSIQGCRPDIPAIIKARIEDEVAKNFEDKTQEDLELLVHGNE